LRAAARIARGQPGGAAYADQWTREADELRIAWWRAFNTKEREDDRSAIIGLWPSNIAGNDPVRYSSLLAEQWNRAHDSSDNPKQRPLWTYFTIANAHEWLLEEPAGIPEAREHVWKTIDWFWANQTSPGLYTWWEGAGEENSFGLWQGIRGWVRPHYVTPHYWTAAEMLALQLDMLVHEDSQGNLIIGLGIPDSWVDRPMHVAGIECSRGTVAWNWDGHRMQVFVNNKPALFVLGPAFKRVIDSQHQQASKGGMTPVAEIAHIP
jgi:hypothetical protein